jgi:GxxExxY protein
MERQDAKTAKNARKTGASREPSPALDEIAHRVIGAALDVHRELGPGFLERVYEDALCIELGLRGIGYDQQLRYPVHYKGILVAESQLDLLVEGELVVELKAVEELRPIHTAQVLSYLRAGGFQLGLLFNFNVYSLRQGTRRVILTL